MPRPARSRSGASRASTSRRSRRAGVRGGDFTLEAAHPFSPVDRLVPRTAQHHDAEPERHRLRFPRRRKPTAPSAAACSCRTAYTGARRHAGRDQLRRPHGARPARTADSTACCRFRPARYTITARRRRAARADACVRSGRRQLDVDVQLLGLGATTIVVQAAERSARRGTRLSRSSAGRSRAIG